MTKDEFNSLQTGDIVEYKSKYSYLTCYVMVNNNDESALVHLRRVTLIIIIDHNNNKHLPGTSAGHVHDDHSTTLLNLHMVYKHD